jgi:hypothetical protein
MSDEIREYRAIHNGHDVRLRYRPGVVMKAHEYLGDFIGDPNETPILNTMRFWDNATDQLVIDSRVMRTGLHTMSGSTLAMFATIGNDVAAHAQGEAPT